MGHFSERFSRVLPAVLLLLSAVFPLLVVSIITPFPSLGLAFFFATLSTLAFISKKEKQLYDKILYVSMLLLSFFLFFRANEFQTFLNTVALLYLGSCMLMSRSGLHHLVDVLFAPFIAIGHILNTKSIYRYNTNWLKERNQSGEKIIQEHLPAVLITGFLLLIVIPLLSYANPFFNQYVTNITKFLDMQWFNDIFGNHIVIHFIRVILFLLFLFFLPKFATYAGTDEKHPETTEKSSINLLIPKIVLSVVLFIFFITQIQLYTASFETLQQMNYTNSQQTREVFGQLSIVALITFFLIYADSSRKKLPHILTYVLIIEAFFLTGIALKSVLDYTSNWGFTHKRLYGYAVVTWITGIFALFTLHYIKGTKAKLFFKYVTVLSALVILAINIANFDWLIYHHRKASTSAGIDHNYLANTLSADAHSYKEEIEQVMSEVREMSVADYTKTGPAWTLLYRIETLQSRYKDRPISNAFNWASYQEYLDVKDIDVVGYRNEIDEKMRKLSEQNATVVPTVTLPSQ